MATRRVTPKTPKLLTRRQLADVLKCSMWAVTDWQEQGMPVAERGTRGRPSLYDEKAVRRWLQERAIAAKAASAHDIAAQARARKDIAQAALAEQSLEIRAGDLVRRDDWERAKIAENVAIKTHLLAWATTLAAPLFRAATVDGLAGVERLIDKKVREVLRELADGRHAPTNEAPTMPGPGETA